MAALNLQTNDLPTQLHRALFEQGECLGAVLKPAEMRCHPPVKWPPLRTELCRVSLHLLSLHLLPVRGEQRPSYGKESKRSGAGYVRELTGERSPPVIGTVSSP